MGVMSDDAVLNQLLSPHLCLVMPLFGLQLAKRWHVIDKSLWKSTIVMVLVSCLIYGGLLKRICKSKGNCNVNVMFATIGYEKRTCYASWRNERQLWTWRSVVSHMGGSCFSTHPCSEQSEWESSDKELKKCADYPAWVGRMASG